MSYSKGIDCKRQNLQKQLQQEDDRSVKIMRMDFSNEHFRLWVLVNQLLRVIAKGRARETRLSGVTPAQFAVIWGIKTIGDSATSAQIGKMILRRPQAMTGLIRRMKEAGLVQEERRHGKRRKVTISLTPKGEESYEKAMGSEIIPDAFSALDDQECVQLYDYLKRVSDQAMKSLANRYAADFALIL